ncbi:unnamed protein product [Symbiodinium sp. CCMP2592]|nr:unnamed protein product [Symbiodinium sp. CCMP2592]
MAVPSELLRCTVYSLVPPVQNTFNEWNLLLSPEQMGHPSKTGEYDTSLALDSYYLKPWGSVVFQALKKQHASTPLWDFNYGEFVREFKLVAEALHVQLSPYQMRHSGPSIDRAQHLRSLLEVQRRGTWKSAKSVLRYEKSARLAASFLELPQRLRVDSPQSTMIGKHRDRYCLDLFSGRGGVSRALRRLGFRCFEYDICHGADHDLTSKSVLSNIRTAIFRGEVLSVMFGTPYSSFSVARDRTSIIRNHLHPWGIPESSLSAEDKEKVRFGNLCAKSTLRIIKWLQHFSIPWCVENPHNSKLWQLPPFQDLLLQPTVKDLGIDDFQAQALAAYLGPWLHGSTLRGYVRIWLWF